MALDAVTIQLLAEELNEQLSGSRVEKISMPSRDEAVFTVRNYSGKRQLILSARSGSARVHFTDEDFDFPATPPAFCMLLRKHLINARFTEVTTIPGDRVLLMRFDSINDMGDKVNLTLSVEMMGRYSNIVLVDTNGIILDAIKRIDETQSDKRQIIPGEVFTSPPVPDKISFLSADVDELVAEVRTSPRIVSDAVLQKVSGLSPLLCREVGLQFEDRNANTLSVQEAEILRNGFLRIKNALSDKELRSWNIVFDETRMVEFSFLPLLQYHSLKNETFENCSDLLEKYYSERDRELRLKNRSRDLSKQVRQLLERSIRKQESRKEDLISTQKADQKRLYGELLTANLNSFKRGDSRVVVLNYYDGETVTIPLDVTKTPNGNAQQYFKEYRKLRTAADVLQKLIKDGDDEIEYLKQVSYDITQASTEEDFMEIRKDLKDAGFLRGFKYKQKGKRKAEPYFRYITSGGYGVLVGKNNTANERLSLSMAAGKDLWFHVKGAPGSHVILKTENTVPDDKSMTEACEIAAYHSSQSKGQLIAVDYTEARRVKKIPGGKPGMVTYTEQKTAYVTPDDNKIESLRQNKKR
ncbi:MAG: NFACT RNA binding domain-containing protein [Oscillospiraceae bacterium]|nr:NFACT RNA binding domain-containing protein [Oscillospiraceae bacterium]